MFNFIQYVLRPCASLLFYKSYVLNDVADRYQEANPGWDRETAMLRADADLREGKIPTLRLTGTIGEVVEDLKPGWGKRAWKRIWIGSIGMFVLGPLGVAIVLIALHYHFKKQEAKQNAT